MYIVIVFFCMAWNCMVHSNSFYRYSNRSNRWCVDTISRVTKLIREAIDEKQTGHACFINLQRAFDILDHSILGREVISDFLKSEKQEYVGSSLVQNQKFSCLQSRNETKAAHFLFFFCTMRLFP